MKKLSFILAMLALVLVVGFAVSATFVSCDNETTSGGVSIVGRWVAVDVFTYVFEFKSDSTFVLTDSNPSPYDRLNLPGTYTISGNRVTLNWGYDTDIITIENNSFYFEGMTFTKRS